MAVNNTSICFVQVDYQLDLSFKYELRQLPTVIIFKLGEIDKTIIGEKDKTIIGLDIEQIQSYIDNIKGKNIK